MFMILFVLDDPGRLDELLEGWSEIGIKGVTIIESSGFYRRQIKRTKLHLTFLVEPVSSILEEGNITLFTAVEDEALVEQCLQKTEQIVGNLEKPHSGVFLSWPLSSAKGLHKSLEEGKKTL
ncbi:hypothetical protein BECAL_02550 [Bellilinea caldifistulae]|uniref:P-II family nitrogen regulator n=1 Tax=Bellilinea caldifistulae TaxID=360411 RepID=A0A0P6XJF3_9CHLR|nr:hypothetical protein [Bellilinea caldifistulae]KPL75819.1 hypothetical protein AC812_07500 [Bellilinea caldifistulae]GAP11362.1 hypothetical protein BECAL_02550 [Bellilinea caldifistulae]